MQQEALTEILADALKTHGVRFRREGVSLMLDDAPMLFRTEFHKTAAYPDSVMMQAAFATEAPALDGRVIWNVFAGIGADEETAVQNGFMKFLVGPFHVLLSALGGHVCSQGSEQWRELSGESGRNWRICDSPLITQGFDDPTSVPFEAVQTRLDEAFVRHSSNGVHWVEAFFAFLHGKLSAVDVQIDGDAWPEGTHVVESWDFQPGGGYKSGRYFFIAQGAG